ncbi:phage capsid protein [Sphingobium sp. LSP13-1-1.1]|uniref:phage capsid protein n=1 Tax=Sphingobium sp. LSP13-1-1.1 TaxID=3135234 RepID=UPI003426DB24
MSNQVNNTAQVTFDNNVELALNQTKSLLDGALVEQNDTGAEKAKVSDIVGNVASQTANERHGDTKYVNTPHDGVWIPKPDEEYYADLVDNADKLATGIDVQGTYTMAAAATINRARDDKDLQGLYGSIISGKDGLTVTPFPGSMIIPVTTGGAAGAQRMNVAKVRAANKLLMQNFNDMNEQRFMTLTSEQMDDLLSEIPVTSADFQRVYGGEFSNGVITKLLGFTIIPIELGNPLLKFSSPLSVDGSGYRKNLFWVKSGGRRNVWQKLRSSVDRLPTKLFSTQVFAGTTVASTRTQAGKVGIILNSEA